MKNRYRSTAAEGALTFFSCAYVFIGLQACFAGWLGPKVTKTQGLEMMSDKLVETLFATAARNEEKSFLPLFWFFGLGKDCAQVSTASPSIIS